MKTQNGLLLFMRRWRMRNWRFYHHVCVVGGGPAGCYTVARLLKVQAHPEVRVDILERHPAPFGLVRYGVSPDHQDVKNVTNTFTQAIQNGRVQLLANVCVGTDVKLSQLLKAYSCVVLSVGAAGEKALNIAGEEGNGEYSAQTVVDWYNGTPERRGETRQRERWQSISAQLSGRQNVTVCVIGNGNVAIDVARILLSAPAALAHTDITQHALDSLRHCPVSRVVVVGRRGVLHAAFTTAEVRDLLRSTDFATRFDLRDFDTINEATLAPLRRPLRRRTELLLEHARRTAETHSGPGPLRRLEFLFNKLPVRIVRDAHGQVQAVRFRTNPGAGPEATVSHAEALDELNVDCQLVVRSLGYTVRLDEFADDVPIPLDERAGCVANAAGRVRGVPGLYCSGWLKTGPRGVIATTMSDAFETADAIVADLRGGKLKQAEEAPLAIVTVRQLVESRVGPHRIVDYAGWKRIDEHEKATGERLGKVREKLLVNDDFLRVANS